MKNSMKHALLILAVVPMLLAGCSDLFDKGDTEKTYEGPDVVEFKPLQMEIPVGINSDGTYSETSRELRVQLISSQGVASSDVNVNFSVDGSSTADASLYNLSSTSVTIPSGSALTTFTITIPANGSLTVGDEFTVILNIGEVTGAEAAAELDQTTIYIQGVDSGN